MSGTTTGDEEELQRRNMNNLAAAVAVGLLCLLGIVVVQLSRRFMNAAARRHADET